MNTKRNVILTAAFVSTWSALMAVHTAKAADDESQYRVKVYQNGPGSQELLEGNTKQAIQLAEHALRLPEPFAALVNLCAAHIVQGDLVQAGDYCDKALQEARAERHSGLAGSSRGAKDAHEIVAANMKTLQYLSREYSSEWVAANEK